MLRTCISNPLIESFSVRTIHEGNHRINNDVHVRPLICVECCQAGWAFFTFAYKRMIA